MTVKEFIDQFPESCDEGREEGLRFETMSDWWSNTQDASYMFWVIQQLGLQRNYTEDQYQQMLGLAWVELENNGMTNNLDPGWKSPQDWCYLFWNYVFYNLDKVYAPDVRRIFGNPFS